MRLILKNERLTKNRVDCSYRKKESQKNKNKWIDKMLLNPILKVYKSSSGRKKEKITLSVYKLLTI